VHLKFEIYVQIFRALVDIARELHFRLLSKVVETGDFSLWRSPRRGAVLETTNQDVADKVIELVNCWRKKEAARVPRQAFQCGKFIPKSRAPCPPCQSSPRHFEGARLPSLSSGGGLEWYWSHV
jgi:hypothetical protein